MAALPGMRPCGLPTRGWWIGLHGDHFLLLLLLRHRSFFAKDRQEDDGGDVVSVSWQNIVANAMGIPGLLLATWLLRRLGTKKNQLRWRWILIVREQRCILFWVQNFHHLKLVPVGYYAPT